ncbi:MAG: glycosyltransferase family protein [candidate division Zixibacteria bacterium]|nr:glycosyltransferase family protein [candidate division Zixibacteria bacterium]
MILAVLQARTSSSRLPGKVLKPIMGKPMLARQLERVNRASKVDRLIVATSVDVSDNDLATLCGELGQPCFRGSLDDVLNRFYLAVQEEKPEHVVRLTGDCPLADPSLIDSVIQYHLDGAYDYVSNGLEPTFPDGLDVEVMRFVALETAWKEAKLPSEREHVTPFIWNQPERFKIAAFKGEVDRSHLRWTVDEPDDLELVRQIYGELYPRNPEFTTEDILQLLEERPELCQLNSSFKRNEGFDISLEKDKAEGTR